MDGTLRAYSIVDGLVWELDTTKGEFPSITKLKLWRLVWWRGRSDCVRRAAFVKRWLWLVWPYARKFIAGSGSSQGDE